MRLVLSLIFLFTFFYGFPEKLVLSNGSEPVIPGHNLSYFEDVGGKATIKEVKNASFTDAHSGVLNLGVSSSTFWVKLKIKNNTVEEGIYVVLGYPILDELDSYIFNEQGKQISTFEMGDMLKYSDRVFDHQNFIIPMSIKQGQSQTLFLKIRSAEQILVPVSVVTAEKITGVLLTKDVIFGLYFGIIIVMFLYNLFLYFSVKDKSYLYYVIYILFIGLTHSALEGLSFKYLWPNFPLWSNISVIVFPTIAGIAVFFFQRKFLNTAVTAPFYNKITNGLIAIYLVAPVMAVLGYRGVAYRIIDVVALLGAIVVLLIAIKVSRKGFRPAKFFLTAWIVFLMGILVFVLRNFGVLPYSNYTNYTMELGTAVEVVLLSFALADRINILKMEKEASQIKALEASQENERIIREQNINLERSVKERTVELEEANEELNAALSNLKNTQTQLVDAEKMASLGQLTAGIAHEINNPINFVTSNIQPLKRDLDDILEVLGEYDKINLEVDLEAKLTEIKELKEDIELDYIVDEMRQLLGGIEEGASRTAEIIRGLRNFSRLDENDLKEADLNEGLRNTLILVNSQIKGNVEVIKDLGQLPLIECYPGKLNQVFMNIINNAIHAVNDISSPRIDIRTYTSEEKVIVEIGDNGPGISDEVKDKIFDPFFTTKDVGEGTGLGLSIVYQIIDNHGGAIQVESEKDKGSTFKIILPIKRS